MGMNYDGSIIVQGSGARIRVWRTNDLKWHTECLTHGVRASDSGSRPEAASKRLSSSNWCGECKVIVLANLPPMTPCCFGKKNETCGRRAYFKTTNITDDVFYLCRMHVKVVTDKGVACEPMEGMRSEGNSNEAEFHRSQYMRERESKRRVKRNAKKA